MSANGNTHRNTLLSIRAAHLEQSVLHALDTFAMWGAGKDGKKLYR
jgi:hypothetical protein